MPTPKPATPAAASRYARNLTATIRELDATLLALGLTHPVDAATSMAELGVCAYLTRRNATATAPQEVPDAHA